MPHANQYTSPEKIVHIKESRIAELEARARRASTSITTFRSHAGSLRTAAMPVGVGALIGFLASMDSLKKSQINRDHWWLIPLAVTALGYYLSRKKNPHAQAILAAGGVLLLNAFNGRPKAAPAQQAPAAQPSTAPQQQTQGPWFDTGAVGDDRSAWLQAPTGEWVRVQLQPMLRQFGPALATTSPSAATPYLNAPVAAPITETAAPAPERVAVAMEDPAAALAAAAFAT